MSMQRVLETALDKLASPRSSHRARADALTALERMLAELLLVEEQDSKQDDLALFLELQDTFQCNIASRTLAWLVYCTNALKKLRDGKGVSSTNYKEEINAMSSDILQALSLLQGVALIHKSSKDFLGRQCSVETFVDLLSLCRHAASSPKPFKNTTNASPSKNAPRGQPLDPSLAPAVLDTLLCVLVDSSAAIRAFEESSGVELIVKILKRSAVPKDVRMKCLEFLYFYLMDESSPASQTPREKTLTRPTSPMIRTSSGSSIEKKTGFPTTSSSSGSAILESFTGPESSTSSFSSWSPTPTLAGTPPRSPTKSSSSRLSQMQSHSHGPLAMLRKEVDFVPLSPKKAQFAQLGRRPYAGGSFPLKFPNASVGKLSQKGSSRVSQKGSEDTLFLESDVGERGGAGVLEERDVGARVVYARTYEEKKEYLGQLLGNVDALVEGVRKVGIWGLGE